MDILRSHNANHVFEALVKKKARGLSEPSQSSAEYPRLEKLEMTQNDETVRSEEPTHSIREPLIGVTSELQQH